MPLPDQTPKLPKLPFLIGDAALLAGGWFIAAQAPHPLPLGQTLAIAGCVGCAGLLGVIPFLTDYARRQDEALDDRQRGLEALARTVASSAEQISIATQGLQEITTLAQKNLYETEHLPLKLQEKMTEMREKGAAKVQEKMTEMREKGAALAADKQKAEKELAASLTAKAERLEAVAEQIAKGAADWAKADAAFQKMVATLEKFPARPGARPKPEAPAPPAPPPEENPPVTEPLAIAEEQSEAPPPAPAPAPAAPPAAADAALALPLDFPPPVAAPKAPRKPRKPRAEPAPEAKAPETEAPPPAAEPAPAPGEFSQVSPDEAAPPAAVSSDGSTRLLVTAYIGIGNRLFLRGDGPGLSWEKGVPLQFISIGKWRWESAEASAPIRFKLYKNDEIECVGLGEGLLEAGRQRELTAAF